MRPPEHFSQASIRRVQAHADEASDFATGATQAHRAAQEHDVRNRWQRRHRHFRPQLDLAVVVRQVDVGERPRHGLRSELAVGAEDDPSNLEAGGLELESRQASHAMAVLANVSAKQQFHGNLRASK